MSDIFGKLVIVSIIFVTGYVLLHPDGPLVRWVYKSWKNKDRFDDEAN